jgi:hypothetical protein
MRFIENTKSAIVLYVLFHCILCVFDKSHPSKCFSYESISLFWYYINIFIWYICIRIFSFGERWNVPFNSAVASLNGTFHLSPHENTLTIALINIHYLYILYNSQTLYVHILFLWEYSFSIPMALSFLYVRRDSNFYY